MFLIVISGQQMPGDFSSVSVTYWQVVLVYGHPRHGEAGCYNTIPLFLPSAVESVTFLISLLSSQFVRTRFISTTSPAVIS